MTVFCSTAGDGTISGQYDSERARKEKERAKIQGMQDEINRLRDKQLRTVKMYADVLNSKTQMPKEALVVFRVYLQMLGAYLALVLIHLSFPLVGLCLHHVASNLL